MLKYRLVIEGTAEEIAEAKLYRDAYEFETVEFITREPKYRCKTLGELVFEYGDRLNCDVNTVYVLGCTNYRTKLGLPEEANYMSKEWKEIFLKEIT